MVNNNNVVNSGYNNGYDQGQQSSVVNNNNVVNSGNGGYNSAPPSLDGMLLPGAVWPKLWGVVVDMWCSMLCCRWAVGVDCQQQQPGVGLPEHPGVHSQQQQPGWQQRR